mmetsp:Transcript_31343/g.43930  ORF Transcript_31343/g.43930 Transcript_31343/m.43930 type:complete len:538 (-) Transcript_31343:223-1836(-)
MLFQLRDQGLLPQGLDTAVSDILPGWVDPPLAQPSHLSGVQRRRAASTRSLTLRALATHSSGLVREVPPCDNCTEIQRLAAIAANTSRLFPMYARTLYSNLGIAVLGRALEKVAGKTWEEWVESEIMKPLAMADSGAKCTSDVPGVVIGADPASGKAIPAPGDWDWGAPCGSVYTSAADMTRFMNFLLGFEPSEASTPSSPSPSSSSSSSSSAPTVLDPSSLAEMQRIVFAQRDGISGVASGTFEGAVMEVDQPEGVGKMRGGLFQRSTADIGGGATKDRTVRYWSLSKLGCIEGFRAAFTLVPSLSLGVFAAVGSTCDMYGDGDVISFPVTNALLDGVGQLLRAREEQRAKRLPGKEQVGDYLGQYDCGYGSNNTLAAAVVALNDDGLLVLHNSPVEDPRQGQGTPFLLRWRGGREAEEDGAKVPQSAHSSSSSPSPSGLDDSFRLDMGDGADAESSGGGGFLPVAWPACHSQHFPGSNLCTLSCFRRMARGDYGILDFIRGETTRNDDGAERQTGAAVVGFTVNGGDWSCKKVVA